MIFMFLLPCVRLPHAETKHKLCHASLQLQSPDPGHFVTSSSSKHTSQQLHNYIVRFIRFIIQFSLHNHSGSYFANYASMLIWCKFWLLKEPSTSAQLPNDRCKICGALCYNSSKAINPSYFLPRTFPIYLLTKIF